MLKRLSLRMRLTLLSAAVMAFVAIILAGIFLFGADRIFVRELEQKFTLQTEEIFLSSEIMESVENEDLRAITVTLKNAGNQFNVWGLAGLLLVLIMGIGATWLMAGRVLKPLGELSNTIEEIGGNNLSRRVEIQGRQDELGRLAHSFNHMMDKVSASFEWQKRFSASAAHELKTPLATIMVNLDVLGLDEQPSPARMEKVLGIVRTNTDRMSRLVDDLFQLMSEEDSDMCEKIQLDELIAEAVDELCPLIREKNLKVSTASSPGINLTCNREMLYRAMSNLIENAVKYNREGGSIVILAKRTKQYLLVCIADTGIGIPAEELEHIFEPFYRVDRSRSRAVGGAGLGLPLVKDIIEKHGGSIEVKSVPNTGTEFIISIPWKAG